MLRDSGKAILCGALMCLSNPLLSASNVIHVNPSSAECSNELGTPFCDLDAALSQAPDQAILQLAAGHYLINANIRKSITITGDDQRDTLLDGAGAGSVLVIAPNTNVTLQKLAVQNGLADFGGGIVNHGALKLNEVSFSSNVANKAGGAIYNLGKTAELTIVESTFTENQAMGDDGFNISYGGGAIYNQGQMSIEQSRFFRNRSQENGGAIYNTTRHASGASVEIRRSFFEHNDADYGGALNTRGPISITDSRFESNKASISERASGGAIFAHHDAALFISNSVIKNNQAILHGGGIRFYSLKGGDFKNLSIVNNKVSEKGRGAGIFVLQQTEPLYLQRSLLVNNLAGDQQASDCSGVIASRGYNLLRHSAGCELDQNETDVLMREGDPSLLGERVRPLNKPLNVEQTTASDINCAEGSDFAETPLCYVGALLSVY